MIKCYKCGKEWEYTGKADKDEDTLTCSNRKCLYKIKLGKAKEYYLASLPNTKEELPNSSSEIISISKEENNEESSEEALESEQEIKEEILESEYVNLVDLKSRGLRVTKSSSGKEIIFEEFGNGIEIKKVGFKRLEDYSASLVC